MHRRNFLRGLIAAPAIVAINNIMPVKLFDPFAGLLTEASEYEAYGWLHREVAIGYEITREQIRDILYPPLKLEGAVTAYDAWPRIDWDDLHA